MKWILLVAVALLGTGCTMSRQDQMVGVWTGVSAESNIPMIPIPAIEKQISSLLSSVILKLRSDKTFVLSASTATVSGKWRIEGSQLYLTTTKGTLPSILGVTAKDVTGQLNKDYTRITLEQPSPFGAFTVSLR